MFALQSNLNAQNLPDLSSGKIERFELFQSQYVTARNVDVWLPDSYSEEDKYAVLYMHDGQMLFDAKTTWNKQEWGADEIVSNLMEKGKIKDCIIVAIWNISEERHSDYFPQKPFESLSKHVKDSLLTEAKRYGQNQLFSKGLQSDNYLKFIVNEVKPYIDSAYSVHTDVMNTFIAGSSMGGLISMYALCEYPNVFGGAACLSTHWIGTFTDKNNPIPDAFFNYMKENLPGPEIHKLYFDYGTETLDAFYEPFQLQADEILRSKGYDGSNFMSKKFEGHDHSENAWKKRLHIPLTFLLR
jgi:enterochelin esterase-like enzyme